MNIKHGKQAYKIIDDILNYSEENEVKNFRIHHLSPLNKDVYNYDSYMALSFNNNDDISWGEIEHTIFKDDTAEDFLVRIFDKTTKISVKRSKSMNYNYNYPLGEYELMLMHRRGLNDF